MRRLVEKVKTCRAELLILVCVCAVLSFWVSQKEGFHMDEMISYEMANAQYNPWIVPTQPEGRLSKFVREEIDGENLGDTLGNLLFILRDTLENRGNSIIANYKADVYEEPVWIDRQRFIDYVTVDGDDAFNYLSVYFNFKDDNHPPLFQFALHTVSSLFWGRIEAWMGCTVNIISVLGSCILLMQLGKELCGRREYGWMAAILYGGSAGAIATALLTRMYGMLTCFCLCELYIHIGKWKKDDWKDHNKGMILLTAAGFLTQYFFVLYMLGLALVTVVGLLRRKQKKETFCYIRSMVIAAVIGVGVYPFSISHILSSGRGVDALSSLAQGFQGYGERMASFGRLLVSRFPGGIFGVTVFFLLLAATVVLLVRESRGGQKEDMMPLWMLAVPLVVYFLLASKLSPFLVDRYIMPVFPLAALFLACLLAQVLERIRFHRGVGLLAALVLAVIGSVSYDGEYLYRGYDEQLAVAKEYGELPCVCVYVGYGFYENLLEFTEYEETLLVTAEELETRSEDGLLENGERFVMLVKNGVDQAELESLLSEKYELSVSQVLFTGGAHQDSVWLCQR